MDLNSLIFYLLISILVIVPFWKIFERVGHSPSFSILMVVPLVNLFFLYYLAFSEWPIFRKEE